METAAAAAAILAWCFMCGPIECALARDGPRMMWAPRRAVPRATVSLEPQSPQSEWLKAKKDCQNLLLIF
jgi:hypothetical protein